MKRQLALNLPPARTALGRADFFEAASNAMALAAVERWREWPGGRLVLAGPQGSGKTHLAHVWAATCPGARIVEAAALTEPALPALATAPLALEGAEALAGDRAAETMLFHLLNMLAAEGKPLLVSATRLPAEWGLRLPDLESRLSAAAVARLEPPCDALLSAVLVKLFADRQITVQATLIPWLVRRMERSFDSAAAVVAHLDREGLARGQAVGIPLAREVLDFAADADKDDESEAPSEP